MTACFCGRHSIRDGECYADAIPGTATYDEVHTLLACRPGPSLRFWEPASVLDIMSPAVRDDQKTPAMCRCPIKELTSVGHLRDCAWVKHG